VTALDGINLSPNVPEGMERKKLSLSGEGVYSHCTNRFEHHTVAVFSLDGATAR